ncbi:hypothetical protein F943_02159 [Acinetobacter ursingii NIPH 706]|uniref:hypothetical protein n=1 Tax=Acinetobacter TaxID=469 RepID=UPI0002D02A01|nr:MULTISPECIES: hypothetical protein [Acinetobacter]ENX48626.1 hypothetical protein F943_02159 [Acinetobacter ursingii NIPH 706]EXD36911.1 hypothetical protein J500_0820 [Acinetobacter sp. 479375]RSO82912.1 hypothetical protein EA748_08155 [Acinetobacter ursingii]
MSWIKDKAQLPERNSMVAVAIQIDEESVDYHVAYFDVCNEGKDEFVLAQVGEIYTPEQIAAWQPLTKI